MKRARKVLPVPVQAAIAEVPSDANAEIASPEERRDQTRAM
jgi:hypothetical protein